MPWNYRAYGLIDDPIHKSDLNSMVGDYGCLSAFKRNKDLVADGGRRDSDTECNGRMVAGTATHECVARALGNAGVQRKLIDGTWEVRAEQCRKVWDDEFARGVAGRQVRWFNDKGEDDIGEQHSLMLAGLLNDVRHHVGKVVLMEAGFIVKIGAYWCSGHTDLIYEPRELPGELGLADWKTGAQRPVQIELDHSWESGVYSAAMRHGLWIPREHCAQPPGPNQYMREREALESELIRVAKAFEADGVVEPHVQILGKFPAAIRYVHLADYPPYKRAGKKAIERPEELDFYGADQPTDVKYKAGDRRGPAWYRVRRTEQDLPRLENLLRNLVGTVRMGRFFESVGEKCTRCMHREPCLNSGYIRDTEQAQLETALRGIEIDDDGLGNVA